MTPEKLEKIRALANDLRGDPATRMIALKILARYAAEPTFHDIGDDELEPPKNPPGMKNSDEYEQHVFMSMHNWGRSQNGNLVHSFTHKGKAYRVTLFAYKKSPTYGWVRTELTRTNSEVWCSNKFRDLGEAHRDAWASLTRL